MEPGVKFLGIPGIFLHHYKSLLAEWIGNIPRYGAYKVVWLQMRSGLPVKGDGSSPPWVPGIQQVTLAATIVGQTCIVRPKTARDERLIKRHVGDLEDFYDTPDEGAFSLPGGVH